MTFTIQHHEPSPSPTLFAATFGIIGVLVAVYVVKSLNVAMLQWVVAAVVLYAGLDILTREFKSKQGDIAA